MDIETLISAVFVKTPIWDKKNKLHSNRNVVDKCWREICAEMQEDETKLKKKWKYLRDQFAVEYGKIPPSRSGDPGHTNYTTKWPYFQSLLFLKDIVKPRKSSSNLKNASISRDVIEPAYEDNDIQSTASTNSQESPRASTQSPPLLLEQEGDLPIPENPTPQSFSQPSRKRRTPTNSYNGTLLDIEKQKLQFLQEKSKQRRESNAEDEHLLFFKSLLPHVRRIPHDRLLSFRNRVQETVEQFAYSSSWASPCTSVTLQMDSPQNNPPQEYRSPNLQKDPQTSGYHEMNRGQSKQIPDEESYSECILMNIVNN